MTFLDRYPEIKAFYDQRGIMGGRCGYGDSPAIVVIDLARAWTDPASPIGSSLLQETVANTAALLDVARDANPAVPIYFTTMAYDPTLKDLPSVIRKKRRAPVDLIEGTKWVELDPLLRRRPEELLYVKRHASAFKGTTLLQQLIDSKRDTLIIVGCSITSCVHATAQDSIDLGFHTIVPIEAVGDRNPQLAEWMLIDIDLKLGDVVPSTEVIEYLQRFRN